MQMDQTVTDSLSTQPGLLHIQQSVGGAGAHLKGIAMTPPPHPEGHCVRVWITIIGFAGCTFTFVWKQKG